jgi:hypothetical protein
MWVIPENLREQWELVRARAEVLFLADHGGGCPDCLAGDGLTPAARRVILRRMGFRVAEEYDMPDPKDLDSPVGWPWVRLTNNVAVSLADGFVSRAKTR